MILDSPSWWVWAVLLFFFGLRHPVIYDATKLDKNSNGLWTSRARRFSC